MFLCFSLYHLNFSYLIRNLTALAQWTVHHFPISILQEALTLFMENSVFHINNYILDCLYLVPFCAFCVCLIWCSQDSILQLLGTKVSNFWENVHINIWTFTVSNGNLLGESHERILENEIFYILYGTLFLHFALLFHPSNRGLQILHESDVFLPFFYFSSKHDHLCYILFLLFYLSILSSDLSIFDYQDFPIVLQ